MTGLAFWGSHHRHAHAGHGPDAHREDQFAEWIHPAIGDVLILALLVLLLFV